MTRLADVSQEQRTRLEAHVASLPQLADEIERAPEAGAAARLAAEHDFFVQALIPHMATVESTLYPELDRLLSCRLAMTPMAREHETIRILVIRLGELRGDVIGGSGDSAEVAATIRRLHAVLEPHLREEAHYVPILDRYLDEGRAASLAAAVDAADAPSRSV